MINITKYISVTLASSVKFLGGPIAGFALKLNFWETSICSALGMMITVSLLLFAEKFISPLIKTFSSKKRKVFSKTKRFYIKIKWKFGLPGIALLTPFLLTPPGGSLVALSFKYPKRAIFLHMLYASLLGGCIQSGIIYLIPIVKAQF